MVDIARRNLFQEKLRFIISSGGVALAIMLILVLNGFFAGLNRQVTAYLDNTPVDLVVAQKGLRNFVGTTSIVPLSAITDIEKVPGVKKVIPVFVSYAVLEIEGRKIFDLIIGFDPKKGGGPWKMEKGNPNIKNGEMIYDQTAARRSHLKLGDKVNLLGKEFKIVGLSGGTSSWMTGTSFITFNSAARLRRTSGTAGFILVSVNNRSQNKTVKSSIADKVPNLSVVSKETMAANDVKLFAGVFSGPLRFMVIIAFLVGLMLVGLTIYTATVERAREYGVLKAIGIKNWRLYLVVFEQALIASAVGSVFGVAFSFLLVQILTNSAPQFLILIEWSYIIQVLPLAIIISILASYIPVRTIGKIDPAIAFRKGALT